MQSQEYQFMKLKKMVYLCIMRFKWSVDVKWLYNNNKTIFQIIKIVVAYENFVETSGECLFRFYSMYSSTL